MFTPKLPFLLFLALQLTLCLTKDAECTITTDSEGVITDDCPVQHNCIEGTCVHKDIFPLNGVEIASSILIMVVAGFANSGGIGGGAILSPILLLLFKYNASKTIMLVYVLIFGGSFGTFLNVAFQRDIKTGKPIVLYDFLVIVGPVMLIGSNLGVMLNRMIPPILTICGLVYLIITTLLKISKKAKSSYAQETEALQKPLLSQKDTKGNNPRQAELSSLNYQTNEDKPLPHNVKAILQEDQSFLPKRKLLLLGCLLTFLILTTVLRGSDKFDSVLGIEFCSFGYWIWFLFGLAGCYFFHLRGSKLVLENAELKRTYHCEESTYQVNEEYIKRLGSLGVFAGVLAALLGIGGGLVLGSTLLTMGVEAQSMTATSNSFVVLTALISLFQAFLFGGISTNELIFFFLISSIGSYSVSAGLSWVVKKTRRPSILLIILSCMLSLALVVMPTFAVYKSIESPSQMLSFHSVC